MSALVCYELNEVPWKVVDRYTDAFPNSFLARHLIDFDQFTTRTRDSGELHPWSTWPTMHRGVSNDSHGLRYINQSQVEASRFPPVWDILSNAGVSVGVFGSLQSFPPRKNSNVQFYVPDTFAPVPDAFPSDLRTFQRFNLAQAGESKAVVNRISPRQIFEIPRLMKSGVRTGSVMQAGLHIFKEKLNSDYKSMRPLLQPVLGFDVFMKALRASRPQFSTFFTNHVAGAMHRYWRALFPEDTPNLASDDYSELKQRAIFEAMHIADKQIEELFNFCKRTRSDLVVASSMGQGAIVRDGYVPELLVRSIDKVTRLFQVDGRVRLNPAMQPDIALEFDNKDAFNLFVQQLPFLVDDAGLRIFEQRYEATDLTLNLSVTRSASVAKTRKIIFNGRPMPISELDMEIITRDPGTGYHIPDGIILWAGEGRIGVDSRPIVDSTAYFATILRHFGIDIPEYAEAEPVSQSGMGKSALLR